MPPSTRSRPTRSASARRPLAPSRLALNLILARTLTRTLALTLTLTLTLALTLLQALTPRDLRQWRASGPSLYNF